jgi:hypothetical protein
VSHDPHAPADHVTAAAPHHGHAYAPAHPDFTPEEWDSFRASDKTAATYIVILMQGIFAIGLVLYLIVLWSVA